MNEILEKIYNKVDEKILEQNKIEIDEWNKKIEEVIEYYDSIIPQWIKDEKYIEKHIIKNKNYDLYSKIHLAECIINIPDSEIIYCYYIRSDYTKIINISPGLVLEEEESPLYKKNKFGIPNFSIKGKKAENVLVDGSGKRYDHSTYNCIGFENVEDAIEAAHNNFVKNDMSYFKRKECEKEGMVEKDDILIDIVQKSNQKKRSFMSRMLMSK